MARAFFGKRCDDQNLDHFLTTKEKSISTVAPNVI